MKGFIEVEYNGCGRIGIGHDRIKGKVLIGIRYIKEVVDNMICIEDNRETIYYNFTCSYEEIKKKIEEAQ